MAAVAIQAQDIIWEQGATWCFSRFVYNASAETVLVPTGTLSVAMFPDNTGTAPTATVAAGATGDLVTLTGGTVGKTVTLVSKHAGNPASAR
jgi:hypothetical protein